MRRLYDNAACADTDDDVFFPQTMAAINEAAWRRYCDHCPVVRECALYGAQTGSEGVWGGVFHTIGSRARTA